MNLDQMMSRMGFEPTDTGPYVSDLRKLVKRQMSEGMVNRSAGTWAPKYGLAGNRLSPEERARCFLEVEWEMEHGHSYEVKNLDSGWKRPASKFGDIFRALGFHLRTARSRLLGQRNPYSS